MATIVYLFTSTSMNNRQLMHVIQKALFKLFFFRRFQSKEQQIKDNLRFSVW